MNKKKLEILNQPFVLWFLSSVVIGFISWQYAEIQKNTASAKTEKRMLKRANLELKLLLQDIQFGVEQNKNIRIGHINTTLIKMQYNASRPSNQFYFPTLQNIMLEIDSRTKASGLEKYQSQIFDKIKDLSNISTRVTTPYTTPNQMIWGNLTISEQKSLSETSVLAKSILAYYSKIANKY
jgi:hypothetical protein